MNMETALRYHAKHQVKRQALREAGNFALVISAIAVFPLVAFAALWTACLLMIGGAAILHWVGIW